jgi:hypothetical protein
VMGVFRCLLDWERLRCGVKVSDAANVNTKRYDLGFFGTSYVAGQ